MSAGITGHALRRHRWSLLGPAATQAFAATVLSALLMVTWSLDAAPLTGAQRVVLDRVGVKDALGVFVGDAIYLAIVIVGVTMNLAITRQARDIALLRSVGATPGQIRRSVVAQAAAVALPAAVLGYLASFVVGPVWLALLRAHHVVPASVSFRPSGWPLPIVAGIAVGTSVVGALVAAIRPARQRPARALADAATGRPGLGALRTLLGVILFAGGVVLSVLISHLSASDANSASLFVLLAMCAGIGLLGPVIMRLVGRLVGPVARVVDRRRASDSTTGATGRLALDGLKSFARPLSGALVPLVLAIAFVTAIAGMDAAGPRVTGVTGLADQSATTWLDYSGSAMVCGFAGVAAVNALVTIMMGRVRDLAVLRLVGATRRRVVVLVAAEATVVTATGLGLGAMVALVTLAPTLHTAVGVWLPSLPPAFVVTGLVVTGIAVAAGMVVPAAALTRRRPAEVVAAAGQ
jgi:putative ABC transport system permease protein